MSGDKRMTQHVYTDFDNNKTKIKTREKERNE